VKYWNVLRLVRRSWISEVQNRSRPRYDELHLPERQTTPRGPKQYQPDSLSSDFRIHNLKKIFGGWGGENEESCKTV